MPRTVAAAALFPALLLAAVGLGACRQIGLAPDDPDPAVLREAPEPKEPARVVIRHVLIAFDATDVPGVTRTKEEARVLAEKVYEMARRGRDFAELVRLYSDDHHGDGTYALANFGVRPEPDESERHKMVRGFGKMAFALAPGEIGFLAHDAYASPFGWHVIQRVK